VLGVIPCEGEPTIMASSPILSDLIMAFEGGQEVVYVIKVGVLDGKAINNQGELDVTCGPWVQSLGVKGHG